MTDTGLNLSIYGNKYQLLWSVQSACRIYVSLGLTVSHIGDAVACSDQRILFTSYFLFCCPNQTPSWPHMQLLPCVNYKAYLLIASDIRSCCLFNDTCMSADQTYIYYLHAYCDFALSQHEIATLLQGESWFQLFKRHAPMHRHPARTHTYARARLVHARARDTWVKITMNQYQHDIDHIDIEKH